MSVPTLSGITNIDPADSTTNWSGWGSNSAKWGVETEIVREGSGSVGVSPNATGDGGFGYDSVGGLDATSNLIMIWVYTTPGFASVMASYGVYVRICSGSSWTSEYSDYKVGGSDVAWFGRGWHLIVLDANRTADRSSGTTNKSSIAQIGVGFNFTNTASKSTIMCIDSISYGNAVEVTGISFTDGTNGIDLNENGASADSIDRNDGGSFVTDGWEVGDFVKVVGATDSDDDGVYEITGVAAATLTLNIGDFTTGETANTTLSIYASITLEDIYQKDGPTDDNWYGVVDKDPSGAYIINYPLIIGDVSGALDTFFLSRGEVIVLADQPLDTTLENYITSAEDTGETYILFGDSTGTGNNRVGFAGSVIVGQGTVFDDGGSTSSNAKTPRGIDLDAEISGLEVYGSTFIQCDGGVTYATTGTGHYVTNVTFDGCGQVAMGAVEGRNLTFTGYEGSSDAALLWNENIDIRYCNFLANTQAIEHPSAAGSPYGYQDFVFGGNTYDVNNTSGSAITIGNTDSNATTYTGSTVTFQTTVALKVTVYDEAGDPVQNAQTGIYALETVGAVTEGDELISGSGGSDTNASGIVQNTAFNYQGDLSVLVRSRKSSSGDSPRYKHLESPQLVTSDGLDVIVTLIEDPVNN